MKQYKRSMRVRSDMLKFASGLKISFGLEKKIEIVFRFLTDSDIPDSTYFCINCKIQTAFLTLMFFTDKIRYSGLPTNDTNENSFQALFTASS